MELRNQVDNKINRGISEQFRMTWTWKIKFECSID